MSRFNWILLLFAITLVGCGKSTQTMDDLNRWRASHTSTRIQRVWFTEKQFASQFGHPKITPTDKYSSQVGEIVLWEVSCSDGTAQFPINMITKEAVAKQTVGMSKVNQDYFRGIIGQSELIEEK